MEQSNLRLYSNIYPWNGRWNAGDQEFVAKIWDEKALMILKVAERKRELTLTDYQQQLYECTIQCPKLPKGERPWGWVASGVVACLCRNVGCKRFSECRAGNAVLSGRELEVWSGGNQEGLSDFERTWKLNREARNASRDTGEVDLIKVFGGGEYDPVEGKAVRPFDPKIAVGFPDDEEYE